MNNKRSNPHTISSFSFFKKKYELSDKEKEYVIQYEKKLQKKRRRLNEKNNNCLITLDEMSGVKNEKDEEIQCDEKRLDEELIDLKKRRSEEKARIQNMYIRFKQDQNVVERKINNGKILEISFSGNKTILNDRLKECRFKDTRHIIYPLKDYSFRLLKTKSISFKFEMKSNTVWIAVGLCDLKKINSNNRLFYKAKNNEFPHGTFALGSVRKFQEGYKVMKFHHEGNACGAYDVQNDFPYFLPGRVVNVFYDTETRKIIYTCGVCEVIIDNVTSVNGEDDILAPCIIFFYDSDIIQLYDFKKINK